MAKSVEELEVWQHSMELAERVYVVTRTLGREELFGLSAQLRRAAVSVPSNIAEGHARGTTREYLRGVSIALGSVAEIETQLKLAQRLGLTNGSTVNDAIDGASRVRYMLLALRASLQRKLDDGSPGR